MKKRIFPFIKDSLVTVLTFMPSLSTYADEPVTLNIHLSDGTTQAVQLYTKPQVTFEGNRVVFTSSVATFNYDAQQVLRFTYSRGCLPDKVLSPESQNLFRQSGEQITFDANIKASDIQLFTEDGMSMPVNLTTTNGHSCISVANIPKGAYVLKVKGHTYKVVKR